MTDEDLEFLCEHQESSHPLHAPYDCSIKVSLPRVASAQLMVGFFVFADDIARQYE